MIIEKSVMKTEAKFSDDKEYRYILSKEWNNKKPRAMVIMTNPSSAGEVALDLTTLYTINNLVALDYGAVDIVNIYPKVSSKLRADDVDLKEIGISDQLIVEMAEKVDSIIIAWGRIGEKSKAIEKRQNQVFSTGPQPHLHEFCNSFLNTKEFNCTISIYIIMSFT